jgi:hypothetical protein
MVAIVAILGSLPDLFATYEASHPCILRHATAAPGRDLFKKANKPPPWDRGLDTKEIKSPPKRVAIFAGPLTMFKKS